MIYKVFVSCVWWFWTFLIFCAWWIVKCLFCAYGTLIFFVHDDLSNSLFLRIMNYTLILFWLFWVICWACSAYNDLYLNLTLHLMIFTPYSVPDNSKTSLTLRIMKYILIFSLYYELNWFTLFSYSEYDDLYTTPILCILVCILFWYCVWWFKHCSFSACDELFKFCVWWFIYCPFSACYVL